MHSRAQSSYVIPIVLLLYKKDSSVPTCFKIGSLTKINDTMNQKQFLLHTSALAASTSCFTSFKKKKHTLEDPVLMYKRYSLRKI